MDFFSRGRNGDAAPSQGIIDQAVQMCPFLRNINEPTNFCFAPPIRYPTAVKGGWGPIFKDGPSFETAFRLFHGHDGVVPLSGRSSVHMSETSSNADYTASEKFNPFAAYAAPISLSPFGLAGPLRFDSFMAEQKHNKKNEKRRDTSVKMSDPLKEVKGGWGPIFEDGPSFETAFRLFHGHDGWVPLSGRSSVHMSETSSNADNTASEKFNPFAAHAATISLSPFGLAGPLRFDSFMAEQKHNKKNEKRRDTSVKMSDPLQEGQVHEATGIEWLETGKCPIAKSYQAVSKTLPLVAELLQPLPAMKIKWPPAVSAACAGLARTPLVKSLRSKPLPAMLFSVELMGMIAVNVLLGVCRVHTQKFSPACFIAILSAIPFIAMLRKSVNMPKSAMAFTIAASILGKSAMAFTIAASILGMSAMAFTIAASILGQVIGSRAEKARLKHSTDIPNVVNQTYEHVKVDTKSPIPATVYVSIDEKGTVELRCGTLLQVLIHIPMLLALINLYVK